MSSPLHKHEGPQWKTFWRRCCPGPQTRGAFGGSYPEIFFVPSKFCYAQKHLCQHMIKIKIFPP